MAARRTVAEIPAGGTQTIAVDVRRDRRRVELATDLSAMDEDLQRILGANGSVLDQLRAAEWLESPLPRGVRKACLLNVLAMTRVKPSVGRHLSRHLLSVFFAAIDRVYAVAEPAFLVLLTELADDPGRPVYDGGEPKAEVHVELLRRIESEGRVRANTYRLRSFRLEGAPSLQAVVAFPKDGADGAYHYADLDLDLGNPLQDLTGFLIHMGELADRGRTDHFKLRKRLARLKAKNYLYYEIEEDAG